MPGYITLPEIQSAAHRIANTAVHTPLLPLPGTSILIKAESAQPIGSFKLRGAYNMIAQLSPDALSQRRHHLLLRQPRPGSRLRRPSPQRQGRHRHARQRPPGQDRRHPRALGAEVVFVGPASSARKLKAEELAAEPTATPSSRPTTTPHILAGAGHLRPRNRRGTAPPSTSSSPPFQRRRPALSGVPPPRSNSPHRRRPRQLGKPWSGEQNPPWPPTPTRILRHQASLVEWPASAHHPHSSATASAPNPSASPQLRAHPPPRRRHRPRLRGRDLRRHAHPPHAPPDLVPEPSGAVTTRRRPLPLGTSFPQGRSKRRRRPQRPQHRSQPCSTSLTATEVRHDHRSAA